MTHQNSSHNTSAILIPYCSKSIEIVSKWWSAFLRSEVGCNFSMFERSLYPPACFGFRWSLCRCNLLLWTNLHRWRCIAEQLHQRPPFVLFSQQFGHNSTAVLSGRIVSHINRTSWWTRHTKAGWNFRAKCFIIFRVSVYMSKVSYVVNACFICLKKVFVIMKRAWTIVCICVGSKVKRNGETRSENKTFAIFEPAPIGTILNFAP